MNEWMNGWLNVEWMNERVNEWINERINKWMNEWENDVKWKFILLVNEQSGVYIHQNRLTKFICKINLISFNNVKESIEERDTK